MGGNNSNSKKARPQSVNDYRKISICNAGYRIYATYLLKLLDEEIETMGNYQAAFMRYRSTDDHIFVVRRILDENGRQPTESCLVSKNIRQSYGLDKNPKYHQRKRVKQGCPLSPRLFTIVLDDVLRTLEELVSEVRLDQDAEINLPVILSFADDIIIIDKDASQDPINKSIAKQTQEINGVLITPVDTIKYLDVPDLRAESKRHDKGKM
ncbi:hypothetical protein EVAR_31529_1 [Eumeta japonica]|uniref:Reverse transcriptase domain-containing protein n=1 Tax=Eumeta variegata TaxID=151549 RepID=A0A4C1Z3J1_EUMVA|nr:hypothetical protein EVAR_31529_1 [Eumeta japonica]